MKGAVCAGGRNALCGTCDCGLQSAFISAPRAFTFDGSQSNTTQNRTTSSKTLNKIIDVIQQRSSPLKTPIASLHGITRNQRYYHTAPLTALDDTQLQQRLTDKSHRQAVNLRAGRRWQFQPRSAWRRRSSSTLRTAQQGTARRISVCIQLTASVWIAPGLAENGQRSRAARADRPNNALLSAANQRRHAMAEYYRCRIPRQRSCMEAIHHSKTTRASRRRRAPVSACCPACRRPGSAGARPEPDRTRRAAQSCSAR